MNQRYQLRHGSQLGHCCIDATVVDTARPRIIGGKPWLENGVPVFEMVCECADTDKAELVCLALNATQPPETGKEKK